jgi:hypothetical protein
MEITPYLFWRLEHCHSTGVISFFYKLFPSTGIAGGLLFRASRPQHTKVLIKSLGGSPEIMADLLAKHIAAIPLIGKEFAKLIQLITLSFVKQGLGKWISDRSKSYFPIGYFLVAKKSA